MEIERDIEYQAPGEPYAPLRTLDVYHEPGSAGSPQRRIVVFLHGGRWSGGDKNDFGDDPSASLPAWFVERGCVFIAPNFALPGDHRTPDATIADAAADIARAIKWSTVHGLRYRGTVGGIVVVGYSSGAHLGCLAVCDPRYLQEARVDRRKVRAMVGLDGAHYDIPLALQTVREQDLGLPRPGRTVAFLQSTLGRMPGTQKRWSPAEYLAPGLAVTEFLLVTGGSTPSGEMSFSGRMSEAFGERLVREGIPARHRHLADMQHVDFVRRYEGEMSAEMTGFLSRLDGPGPV